MLHFTIRACTGYKYICRKHATKQFYVSLFDENDKNMTKPEVPNANLLFDTNSKLLVMSYFA